MTVADQVHLEEHLRLGAFMRRWTHCLRVSAGMSVTADLARAVLDLRAAMAGLLSLDGYSDLRTGVGPLPDADELQSVLGEYLCGAVVSSPLVGSEVAAVLSRIAQACSSLSMGIAQRPVGGAITPSMQGTMMSMASSSDVLARTLGAKQLGAGTEAWLQSYLQQLSHALQRGGLGFSFGVGGAER